MLEILSFAVHSAGPKIEFRQVDGVRGPCAASAKRLLTCRAFFLTARSRFLMPVSGERCSISRALFCWSFRHLGEATAREWLRFWMNWHATMLNG